MPFLYPLRVLGQGIERLREVAARAKRAVLPVVYPMIPASVDDDAAKARAGAAWLVSFYLTSMGTFYRDTLIRFRVRQGSARGAHRQRADVRGRGAAGGRGVARRADRLRHAGRGATPPGALVRGRRRHARADVPPQSHGGGDAPLAGSLRADARVEVMAMDQPREVTPRERVVAAYKGQHADRVPAYPIAGSFAGCLDGLSIEEYCTNPKKAVKAMINYYERYQPDIMIAFNDLAKEAEAVGCHVKYSDYVVPSIDQHVLQDDKGKLARLEVPDPFRQGRLPAFLEQCEALSAQKFPSALGAVLVGPWTIAMLMRNPELMCLDTLEDPEFVHDLMRFATEFARRMGDAVLTTKIGLSYSDPTASCSLVGPDTYREFIKPYHKELVDYFKAKKVGTTVHICGTTHQIHEDLVDVGFVAITIDLDQQGDPKLKVDQLDKLVTLGN